MNNSIKIIYIMTSPPAYNSYVNDPKPPINWNTPTGSWVGIWGYDWAHLIGNELLKVTNSITYEVWQLDPRADKVYKHVFENGLTHMLMPAIFQSGEVFSEFILNRLNKESEDSDTRTLIIQSRQPTLMNSLILEKYSSVYPIINSFLGNFSFMDLEFGTNILKWFNSARRWREKLKYIRKYNYVGVLPMVPNEKKFRDKYISSDQLLIHHYIGISSSYFDSKYNSELIREKLELPKGRKIYLSSSRLNGLKQIDKLIKVFGRLKNDKETLIITGAGTTQYRNYLEKLIDAQNNDIRLVGFLSEEELILHYKAADFFIDASKNDGGPLGAWKAMALGLPVITTATGNVGVFLKNNNSGCTIPVNNYKKWIKIFEKISSGEIGINAADVEKVWEFVSWENCSRKNMNNYYKVIDHFYGK